MFRPSDVVWTGEPHHSGERHSNHWKTAEDWQSSTLTPGPMVHPGTWPARTLTRSAENVLTSPWLVADFDQDPLTGNKPQTPAEIEALHRLALAVVNWLRSKCGWKLGAVIHTGNRSLHAWFARPSNLATMEIELAALGLDPALFRKSQTARLPGQRHAKTGGISRVLWLQAPIQ
jgi:hypothetical protein